MEYMDGGGWNGYTARRVGSDMRYALAPVLDELRWDGLSQRTRSEGRPP